MKNQTALSIVLLFVFCQWATAQNNALWFDGVDDYVEVPDHTTFDFGTEGFTISVWIKTETTGTIPNYTSIVSKTSTEIGWDLYLYDNKLAAGVAAHGFTIGAEDGLVGTTALNDARWHHVALAMDQHNQTAHLYVDGVQEAEYMDPLIDQHLNNDFPLMIGADVSGNYFKGTMDQLNCWKTYHPIDKINFWKDAILAGNEYKLAASYSFNNGYPGIQNHYWEGANALYDAKVDGSHGKLINFDLTGSSNWVQSGVAFKAKLAPTYRLKSTNGTGYLYTMRDEEANVDEGHGWYNEKTTAFYMFNVPAPYTVPLHRLYSTKLGMHFYTTDETERYEWEKSKGYQYIGVAGYLAPRQARGNVMLYCARKPGAEQRIYTTSVKEIKALGYTIEDTTGYVWKSVAATWNPRLIGTWTNEFGPTYGIWYTIINRKNGKNRGLAVNTSHEVAMQEVPMSGNMDAFLWTLDGTDYSKEHCFLVNKKYPAMVLEQQVELFSSETPTSDASTSTPDASTYTLTVVPGPPATNPATGGLLSTTPTTATSVSGTTPTPATPASTTSKPKPPVEVSKLVLVPRDKVFMDNRYRPTKALWLPTNVSNRGTDTYSLLNEHLHSKQLNCAEGTLSMKLKNPGAAEQAFTFVAMEPIEGWFLPAQDPLNAAYPYNKELVTSHGIHIIGTGTTSEWAMLRAQLICENMVNALEPGYDLNMIKGLRMIIISKDDENLAASRYPIIGPVYTDEDLNCIRGVFVGVGGKKSNQNFLLVTEEMMCKKGVASQKKEYRVLRCEKSGVLGSIANIGVSGASLQKKDDTTREFDQVVHEFAHLLDYRLNFEGGSTPTCGSFVSAPDESVECYAIAVQAWFDSNFSFPTSETRAALKSMIPLLYNYVKRNFNVNNTWMPPVKLRHRY